MFWNLPVGVERTFTVGPDPGCVGAAELVEDELLQTGGERGVLRTAASPRSSASRTPFQRSLPPLRMVLSFFLGAGSGFATFRRLANSAFALSTLAWSIGCGQADKL